MGRRPSYCAGDDNECKQEPEQSAFIRIANCAHGSGWRARLFNLRVAQLSLRRAQGGRDRDLPERSM